MKSQIGEIKKLSKQPSWEKLLIDYSGRNPEKRLTMEKYLELAVHYVPSSILEEAVSFSNSMGEYDYEIPRELSKKYPPKYPREIIELEWNSTTHSWIMEFVHQLDLSRELSRLQLKNALDNIRKAIALYVLNNYPEEDEEYEEDEE